MRGPDFSELKWVRSGWLLGFHRLKIVDTSDSTNQPMRREDCYSICNGEIYNHEELREEIITVDSEGRVEAMVVEAMVVEAMVVEAMVVEAMVGRVALRVST